MGDAWIFMDKYFQLLGVPRTVSGEDLKKSYLGKIKLFHPDLNPQNPKLATVQTQEIVEAYQAICKERDEKTLQPISLDIRFSFGSVLDVASSLKRKKAFSEALKEHQRNSNDIITSLKLIHAACRAQVQASLPTLLKTKVLIDSSGLLARIVSDPNQGVPTLSDWADFLNREGQTEDAIQLLADGLREYEDAIHLEEARLRREAIQRKAEGWAGDWVERDLLRLHSQKLYRLTYDYCSGKAPQKQPMPPPEVRVKLLRQIIAFGHEMGYLYKKLATALAETGDLKLARETLNKAKQLDPDLSGTIRLEDKLDISTSKIPRLKQKEARSAKADFIYKNESQLPTEWNIFSAAEKGDWGTIVSLLNLNNISPKIYKKARHLISQAAWYVGYSGNKNVTTELVELAGSGFYHDVRTNSRLSLARLGDETIFSFLLGLKSMSEVTLERQEIISVANYLETALLYQKASTSVISAKDMADQAKQCLADGHIGKARYLLEHIEGNPNLSSESSVEALKLLATVCAKMCDYRAAANVMDRIYSSLNDSEKAEVVSGFYNWQMLTLPNKYDSNFDSKFTRCFDIGLQNIEYASNAESFLPAVKYFNEYLPRIGLASCAYDIHWSIQKEWPDNSYFYETNRRYFKSEVSLSPQLQSEITGKVERLKLLVLTKLDSLVKKKPSAKLKPAHTKRL